MKLSREIMFIKDLFTSARNFDSFVKFSVFVSLILAIIFDFASVMCGILLFNLIVCALMRYSDNRKFWKERFDE